MTTMPIALLESFHDCAAARPHARAIARSGSDRWATRDDLRVAATALGRVLHESGAGSGVVVLLEGIRGDEFPLCALAIWANNGVVLAPEKSSTIEERRHLAEMLGAALVVRPDGRGSFRVDRAGPSRSAGGRTLPQGTCVIKLTSGSTGRPRGIAVTASQLRSDGERIVHHMKITPETVNIAAVPLSHSYGLGNLLMPLVIQGSPVLLVELPTAEGLSSAFEIDGPAAFPGVPYLFDLVARAGIRPSRREPLTCISAGAPLSSRTASAFRRLSGWPVRSFYGTSETGGIAFDSSDAGDAAEREEGMIGEVLAGVEVSLEGDEGRVVVSSDSVAAGYIDAMNDEENSGDAFEAGRFRTEDTARLELSGVHRELRLTGRVSNLINVAGRKVNPREVEQVLMTLSGLRDAAVLGMADAMRGESLMACVVADSDVTREKILAHARRHLSAHKLPRTILFLSEVPRTERGKLDRSRLERVVAGE